MAENEPQVQFKVMITLKLQVRTN